MSRILKVGEEYAVRLLKPIHGEEKAKQIAEALVSNYPEHGFVIDCIEAKNIGLQIELPQGRIADAYTKILPHMEKISAYGFITETTKS